MECLMVITCPNCGAGNIEGSSVCRLCATALEGHALAFYAQAPSAYVASSANRKLEKEATDTVAIEEIECPNCHTMNEAGWSFCQQCGNRLPQWSPPPPPVSEPSVQEGFRTTPTEVPAVEQSYKTVVAEPAPKRPIPTEKPLPTAPTIFAEPSPPPPPPPRTPPPSLERDIQA